jgi:hypothetical protein
MPPDEFGADGELDDSDFEPSLGSSNDTNGSGTSYVNWANITDAEGPEDDLEPSIEGDGRDLEEDNSDCEPSLGWTERAEEGGGQCGGFEDREVCLPVGTAVAYSRYRQFDRWFTNNDGMHVDVDASFWLRRIRNLSERQRKILAPNVDRTEVSL